MERATRRLLILAGVLGVIPAFAGTLMVQPPPPKNLDVREEAFPESSFGAAPNKAITGSESSFATREVKHWDRSPIDDDQVTESASSADREWKRESTDDQKRSPRNNRVPASASQSAVDKGTKVLTDFETSAAIRRKGVQEVALIAGDLGYFPKTIFVSRDVPVRLFVTGASRNTLCFMMESFQVRKQVRSQKIEEVTFTPNVPGQYRFHCPMNGMEGLLVVKELTTGG